MKVFGITGWKNGGKTGLVERLVTEMTGRGLVVSTIKHAHHVADVDHEGTDTYRHRAAGAKQVILSSPMRWAKMNELRGDEEPELTDLLEQIDAADVVIVEGFKSASHPKLEAFREANGKSPLANQNGSIVGVAAKGTVDVNLPVLHLDDTSGIADFILDFLEIGAAKEQPKKLRNDCFALPPGVDWVPVDEALTRLRNSLQPVASVETIPVAASAGRVLASDVVAVRSNPPAPNSAVDGYGLAFDVLNDSLNILPLVDGRAAAGVPFSGKIAQGKAIRILTGAIVPDGVDTVVLEEDVTLDGGNVCFDGLVKKGSNTRKAGEDVATGETVMTRGHQIRPADLALLTAVGVGSVAVHRPLRVGVLSTGDEILDQPDAEQPAHKIFDANRPMLLSMAKSWGFEAVDMGVAKDDPDEIENRLSSHADKVDVILTSGGASAGDEDHVSKLLRTKGTLTSWRIAVKPGRPLAMAMWRGVPVFGLPGNPVAAFVCAMIFARPALSLLAGGGWRDPQGFLVPAAFSKSKKNGRREFLRARLNSAGHAEAFKSEGSGRISGLVWSEGLVELPDEGMDIRKGDPVRYIPFASFGL